MIKMSLCKLWNIIRYGPFMIYWLCYDCLLTVWTRLKKIDYIGVYVKPLSNSERKFLFDQEDIIYGYNAMTMIKIGFNPLYCTADGAADLITHEVLHLVLWNRIGKKAYRGLDKVHKVTRYEWRNGILRIWGIDFID